MKTWRNKLTKKELRHLKEDTFAPGIRITLERLKRTFERQAKIRRNCAFEPCWICKGIAIKLGFGV